MRCVLASKPNYWSKHLYDLLLDQDVLGIEWAQIEDKSQYDLLEKLKPDWVFFFHWSDIVPKKIYESFNCVVLHTANLPDGRGGSPIQNQIIDHTIHTKVNALQMTSQVDAGPIYCSKEISLQGSLFDIWMTIADTSRALIDECTSRRLVPKEQEPCTTQTYKRRKINVLPLESAKDLFSVYRFIQMLDAEGYPPANLLLGDFVLEFTRPKLNSKYILCDLKIRRKNV